MDQIESLRSSVGPDPDQAFQQSLSRLSLHLATRPPAVALLAPPPRRHSRMAWSSGLLIGIIALGAVGYEYGSRLAPLPLAVGDDGPSSAAPAPVLAAVAVAPMPVAVETQTPPDVAPTTVPASLDIAAALPPPPPPAPPVTIPAPEIALAWADIVEIQKRLAALGFDPGPVDGVVGPRTMASAQRYAEQHGQASAGKIDRSLLQTLRQDAGSAPTLEPRAP